MIGKSELLQIMYIQFLNIKNFYISTKRSEKNMVYFQIVIINFKIDKVIVFKSSKAIKFLKIEIY